MSQLKKNQNTEIKESKPQTQNKESYHHPRFVRGILLILISSLIMSLQNIITRVILSKQTVLGVWETGKFISPSLGNSILILVIRMLIALPVLAFVVSPRIYKNTWGDIKSLLLSENKNRLIASLSGGGLLFISSFSIYLALGSIPTGVATTIFFIYPTITILILWIFFQEKPPVSLVFAMITIYLGGFLTIPEASFTGKDSGNVLF
ncbi:MAG: DMT family transporter, partial [Leptospiraceae bacterium]|nr:DMT family transporter [Leptospiraceae bacterium]